MSVSILMSAVVYIAYRIGQPIFESPLLLLCNLIMLGGVIYTGVTLLLYRQRVIALIAILRGDIETGVPTMPKKLPPSD